MLSFWEQRTFTQYDYIIIGSGITGLSTACAIKEKQPKSSVLVLERGLLPSGASTKNAGFACIGSLSEKLSDLKLMGSEAFLKLIESRWIGLYLLRKRLGDEHIRFEQNGGFELIRKRDRFERDELHSMNELLKPIFQSQVFYEKPELVTRFGLNKEMVDTIVLNPFEAQLDTGYMMQTLLNYAGILQIRMITGAEVSNVFEHPNYVEVAVEGANQERISFAAQKIAFCSNAFTGKFFPDLDIQPGRGQVLITSPIENLPFKGVFSFEEGYYYFRNIDNRILLGGGRNLDFQTETTTNFGLNETIQKQLEFYLAEMILPGKKFTIEQRWSGIMAFGQDKLPIVEQVSNRQVIGARMNGMGIALGSKVAQDICSLLLS